MHRHAAVARIEQCETVARFGRVLKILPSMIEADGPNVPIGTLCALDAPHGRSIVAEVVAVERNLLRLVPYEPASTTSVGDRLRALTVDNQVAVGDAFLGRAVNALGQDLASGRAVQSTCRAPMTFAQTTPLARRTPREQLVTGIKAIDGLLPLSIGQRVGIFAASGVGKTSLIQQLLRQVHADRCVLCLIGERGREVEAVWSGGMPADLKNRSVLVASTSDESAVMRVRAVHYGLALARQWRDEGHHVVVFLDSISRYAMAQREIGLAAGEPPTARGYTPNVFAALPKLIEQCGALRSGGAISGFFSVLSETDDNDDPICEVMKSLLDGHIVLARTMADRGHFPAIDVTRSVSRLSAAVTGREQHGLMEHARELLATYAEARLLIDSGLYTKGSAPKTDEAIARHGALENFLRQPLTEMVRLAETRGALAACLGKER